VKTLCSSILVASALTVLLAGCADDDDGTEADLLGVGAECSSDDDCEEEDQFCLQQFKGGYCGVEDCVDDEVCPEGSRCVAHTDGTNYCFRVCTDKSECNANRGPDVESNCSANIVFTDAQDGKACVPPSN
jgi:hypothetical protein